MVIDGTSGLLLVEEEFARHSRLLDRVRRGSASWQGRASDGARELWRQQAGHLDRAAGTMREAQRVLRDYVEQAREAAARRASAERVLDQTPAVAELFDPSGGARERAQEARGDVVRSQLALDEAAALLAVRLAALEDGRRWVIVQNAEGRVKSVIIPSRRQYAAILRMLQKGG